MSNIIDYLPNEIIVYIFEFVKDEDELYLLILSLVCKLFRDLIKYINIKNIPSSKLVFIKNIIKLKIDESQHINKPIPLIIDYAVFYGRFEILKWLHEVGYPFSENVCSIAAMKNHFEILKWLRANGVPWNEDVITNAAITRNYNILIWARANGAPWDENTCSNAVIYDKFDTLKWAHMLQVLDILKHCNGLMNMAAH